MSKRQQGYWSLEEVFKDRPFRKINGKNFHVIGSTSSEIRGKKIAEDCRNLGFLCRRLSVADGWVIAIARK